MADAMTQQDCANRGVDTAEVLGLFFAYGKRARRIRIFARCRSGKCGGEDVHGSPDQSALGQ